MSRIDDLRAAVEREAEQSRTSGWRSRLFDITEELIAAVRSETLAELGDNEHVRNGDTCACEVHRAWAEVEG